MLLEELFQEGFSKLNLFKGDMKKRRFKEPISNKDQVKDMATRVQHQIDNVGPSAKLKARIDKARADGNEELARKIEDNYYHGEAGWSGQTPHQQDINRQTGASSHQLERADWASLTQEEREAKIAQIEAENQKKREAKKAKEEAEKAKKEAEKAEKERKRCENPNALLCPNKE